MSNIWLKVPNELTNGATVLTQDSFLKQFAHCW
jgi:hypothetical protein